MAANAASHGIGGGLSVQIQLQPAEKIEFLYKNHRVEASVDGRFRGHVENRRIWLSKRSAKSATKTTCVGKMCESRSEAYGMHRSNSTGPTPHHGQRVLHVILACKTLPVTSWPRRRPSTTTGRRFSAAATRSSHQRKFSCNTNNKVEACRGWPPTRPGRRLWGIGRARSANSPPRRNLAIKMCVNQPVQPEHAYAAHAAGDLRATSARELA